MQRFLGLDLGSKTLGLSVSDTMGIIASTVTTLRFSDDDYEDALHQLLPYFEKYQVSKCVLGLPKHMNGDVGIRGQISMDFKEMIENHGYEVVLWDERLTTISAKRILLEANVSRKNRKKVIDQMAAVQILQGYLDSQR